MRTTPQRTLAGALLAALVLWLCGGTPAAAAGAGHYNAPGVSQDPTFTVLLTGNLLPAGQTQNSGTLMYLSTTSSGLHKLPFPLFLYNQKYTSIAISSNGNVQPGVTSPDGFPNPNGPFSCNFPIDRAKPLVLAFWAPLYYDTDSSRLGFREGVFVRTTGTAPHRTFTVAWQGQDLDADGGGILVQAVFQEGVQTVIYLYGSTVQSRDFLTIGLQSKQKLSWTGYAACDGTNAPPGTRLTWTHTG